MQYLSVEITLVVTGTLPADFHASGFDEKRTTYDQIEDSITLHKTLRPRYDLAINLLTLQAKTDTKLRSDLRAAMITVRRVGPCASISSTSDTAACK